MIMMLLESCDGSLLSFLLKIEEDTVESTTNGVQALGQRLQRPFRGFLRKQKPQSNGMSNTSARKSIQERIASLLEKTWIRSW